MSAHVLLNLLASWGTSLVNSIIQEHEYDIKITWKKLDISNNNSQFLKREERVQ